MLDKIFSAIGEALGLIKQNTDPEVIRKKKLEMIDNELAELSGKLTDILTRKSTIDNDKTSTDLGVIVDRIRRLRSEHRHLER